MQNIGKALWNLIENIASTVIKAIYRLFNKEISEETMNGFMQFIKFGIVGVSNTLISYILYVVSLLVFQKLNWFGKVDYLLAQMFAFILSVLWSFYWNNKMVFVKEEGQQRNLWKALVKTYISYSFTGLFLNSALLVLWVDVLHISEFVAPIINLLISVPLNFVVNKFWAFK